MHCMKKQDKPLTLAHIADSHNQELFESFKWIWNLECIDTRGWRSFLAFESTDTMLSHGSSAASAKSLHTTTYILREQKLVLEIKA